MLSTERYPGKTGAKRQSFAAANPRDVLLRVIKRSEDEEDARHKCWSVVSKDPNLIRTIYEYWFGNNYQSAVRETRGQKKKRRTKAEIAADVEQMRAHVDRHIEYKVSIKLLNMIMPSGKFLADSTREELAPLSGWVERIVDRLQPGQTVAQAGLTERDLRSLYHV
jgi:hypothetical protein